MRKRLPPEIVLMIFEYMADGYYNSTRVSSYLEADEYLETLKSGRLCCHEFADTIKKLLYRTYYGGSSLHYTCSFIEDLVQDPELRPSLHHILTAQRPEAPWNQSRDPKGMLARMKGIEARVRSAIMGISSEMALALPRASLWGRSSAHFGTPLWILILLTEHIETLHCKFGDLLPEWSFLNSQIFSNDKILGNLKYLYIIDIGTTSSKVYSIKMLEMLLGRPKLEVVDMQNLERTIAKRLFVDTIGQPIHIRELSIEGGKITGEILIAILTKFPSLELLRFEVVCWQTGEMSPGNRNCFGNILRMYGQNLRSLSIGGAWELRTLTEPMGDISGMENLRYLNFHYVGRLLGERFESRLAEILPKSLRCLQMHSYGEISVARMERLRSESKELMEDDDFNELETVHFEGGALTSESGDNWFGGADFHFSRNRGERSFTLTSRGPPTFVYGTPGE